MHSMKDARRGVDESPNHQSGEPERVMRGKEMA